MLCQLDEFVRVSLHLGSIWTDWLARAWVSKASRRILLCLLYVFLGISIIAVPWEISTPAKPALAQPDVEAADSAEAHLGPGKQVRLPAIDNENGWKTWIQIQNVGAGETGVVVFFWGAYSSKCPANDPGAIAAVCMRVVKNGVWTLEARIPTQAKSAIAYAVATTVFDQACVDAGDAVGDTTAWQAWQSTYADSGQPLAVIAQREGPNDFDTVVSSAYPGTTKSMQGEGPPYQYFTPYAMRRYHDLYTVMTIQNGGDQCTPISIYYRQQGYCAFGQIQHVEQLAPGESVQVRVPDDIDCEWLGSAYIQANQPLSIIVDQTSFSKYCLDSNDRGTLLTYWAQPYKPAGDTIAHANLLFREWSGWQTGIQVQNLTRESLPTFVTVDFMDSGGGKLTFLGDWICPGGATTFFLPAITDLGFDYVGAADIQSHKQVNYPGEEETGGQPISAVVDVKKVLVYSATFDRWEPAQPGEAQGGSYNAYPLSAHQGWGYIALPSLSKSDEVISTIAIRNNSSCNRIRLQIDIYDSTGTIHSMIGNLWLEPKQLRLVNLANIGTVVSGFVGAGVVEVTSVGQLCDSNHDGHVDSKPIMPSVTVLNEGQPAGDITAVYDGVPFKKWDASCRGDIVGTVHSIDPCHEASLDAAKPIGNVMVTSDDGTESTTDPTGGYELEDVEYMTRTVTFGKEGFLTWEAPPLFLDCGDDKMLNAGLLCLGEVGFKIVASVVTDEITSNIAGATVNYSKPLSPKAAHYGDYYYTSGSTDPTSVLTLTVPILNATSTLTVSAPGIAETGVFNWMQMLNTPAITTANSIFAGGALNSRVYSDTTPSDTGMWYGFDDGSCANIGSSSRTLNNQNVELILCGYGTVAGQVTVDGLTVPDKLVEVTVNGETVGSATTGVAGTYIISGLPTRCFSTNGCADFSVRCMGGILDEKWEGCGDYEVVNFAF